MNPPDRRTYDAVLRQDLHAFAQFAFHELLPSQDFLDTWHLAAMAHQLTRVANGELRRLIITLPPRHLKSIMASVAFPAWLLGHDPTARLVCVSYGDDLVEKHASDCRALLQSETYQRVFPRTRLSPRKNTTVDFLTTANGGRFSTSPGGTLTGRGGNLIIIDDPMKAADALSATKREAVFQWYTGTLLSRLDNKETDAIVLVMQRLHLEDLVGRVLELDDWEVLNLPAIAPADVRIPIGPERHRVRRRGEILHPSRESAATLDNLKRSLGRATFAAQYQQDPLPDGGALIDWNWFQTYRAPLDVHPADVIVQSWDTAEVPGLDNAYSVCTTWAVRGERCLLLDVWRRQVTYPDLRRALFAQIERWRPTVVVIENASSGKGLNQELREAVLSERVKMWMPNGMGLRPEGDKVSRLAQQSAKIEAGRVYLPDAAPWLPAFKQEVQLFPAGRYADQVDSLSQFLRRLDYYPFAQPLSRVS